MADKIVINKDVGLPERYTDNGDGTWTLVRTATGSAVGDVLISNPSAAGVVERFANMGDGTYARRTL